MKAGQFWITFNEIPAHKISPLSIQYRSSLITVYFSYSYPLEISNTFFSYIFSQSDRAHILLSTDP